MGEREPGTGIPIDGAANLRDLGGWRIDGGGTVACGTLFRSTELSGLTDAGLGVLAGLDLVTVFDLRSAAERDAQPDRLPEGVADIHLDVLADMPGNPAAQMADLSKVLDEPGLLEKYLEGADVADAMAGAYRGIVSLPSALASYRTMFTAIAQTPKRPALFHCTTGKDRTGWGAAALLSLLGVSRGDVITEYLLTNTEILAMTQPMYDTFTANGGDPEMLRPLLGVEPTYLQAAFDEMVEQFGTVEGYFTDGLGLDVDVLDRLRRDLTVAAT